MQTLQIVYLVLRYTPDMKSPVDLIPVLQHLILVLMATLYKGACQDPSELHMYF